MLNIHKTTSTSPVRNIVLCLGLFTFVLLNGCSSVSKKDGPPSFYVDETKIPNAVPKYEKLSRIGNKPYYTVFGKRYYVMPTSRNYEEQGIASWYGTKFHSHHTSNGESYDMLAMTAAHKSLPLPTYVQVTNLKNGKKIIVKVNDRGPFEANRLIDLSYVAAKKLGMIGHGTTVVNVKSVDPRDINQADLYAKDTSTIAPHHVRYKEVHQVKVEHTHASSTVYLQVGVFHNRERAEQLKNRLGNLLGSPVNVNMAKNMYRVQVGPLNNIATANKIKDRLKANGLSSTRVTTQFDL